MSLHLRLLLPLFLEKAQSDWAGLTDHTVTPIDRSPAVIFVSFGCKLRFIVASGRHRNRFDIPHFALSKSSYGTV